MGYVCDVKKTRWIDKEKRSEVKRSEEGREEK
jgi:hypothetical protein